MVSLFPRRYEEKEIISTGFRADLKRHPQTGELLLLTTGFRVLRANSVKGPWTDNGPAYLRRHHCFSF